MEKIHGGDGRTRTNSLIANEETEEGGRLDGGNIVQELTQKLLEISYGLWIYRNLLVHNSVSGLFACECMERLIEAIDEQLVMGEDGLQEEDKWLLEVQLGDLDGKNNGKKRRMG